MIDYEKLDIVHKLIDKHFGHHKYIIGINVTGFEDPLYCVRGEGIDFENYTLDDLIFKLIELIGHKERKKQKYKIGDRVWFLDQKDIHSFVVHTINNECCFDENFTSGIHISCLFSSKEDLIKNQIYYWSDLAAKEGLNLNDHTEQPLEMVKCDHLWHSKSDFLPGLTMNKDPHSCAKCGVLFSREIHGSNSNNVLTAFNNKPIC